MGEKNRPSKERKDVHPHMADLLSATSSYGAHFKDIKSSSKVIFIISNSKQTPYSVISSQGPNVYLIFIPRSFSSSSSIPTLGSSWEHIGIFYNGVPNYKVCSLLFDSQVIESHVPSNLDDFFKFVVNNRLIFLPYEQFKDLHRSNNLARRGSPLISQVFSINRLRVYDVDVNQTSLYSHLFHHLKDTRSVLQDNYRNKTLRHLKLFFSHFKLMTNPKKMENAVFMRSKGSPSLYLRIFMAMMKSVVDESKDAMTFNVMNISKERLEHNLTKRQDETEDNDDTPCAKRPRLSNNDFPKKKPTVFLNLIYDPIFAPSKLICHKCYRLQLSEGSLIMHWIEDEYRDELKSYVSSFWTPTHNTCNEKKCSKMTASLEDMVRHIGLDHKYVFQLFLDESQKALKPCLIRNCTFLTLGIESLLNHMIFSHHYECIVNDLDTIQTIQQFSKTQCPFYECQKFLMKEKLLTHFSLDHGVFVDYMKKPFMNEVELLPYYYEYMLYGYIKSQFKLRYTCDLLPCRSRQVFTCILSYFLHLTERHYLDELKSLFGDNGQGKCAYDTCNFYSSDSKVPYLHLGVYHEIVLFLDTKKRKKDFSRYNVHLLRMYDNLWGLGRAPMYSCGSRRFDNLSLLHINLRRSSQGFKVTCETCRFTLPKLSNSESFYSELIYHSISKEHLLNHCVIVREGNRLEPYPVSVNGIICRFCNVVPDENHHLYESHQELLFSFSKYIEFCSLRNVNPLTCSANEIANFLKYICCTKKEMNHKIVLEMLLRFHEKGETILMDEEARNQLFTISSVVPNTPALYTCFACLFFASSHTVMKEHFSGATHKSNVCNSKSTNHYIRCEACNLFFKLNYNVIDVHRHSRAHLGYAFNIENESVTVPIKKKFSKDTLYDCSLCNLKLSSFRFVPPHARSPMHLEAQTLADAFYSHCQHLKVNPVTCDVSFLKTFLLQYDKPQRARAWRLLHRIHSGMDLAKVHFASDPDLFINEMEKGIENEETISIIC